MNQSAAILAIGTEVTSGQIRNSHATWISSQIDDFGIVPLLHLAVPDDMGEILSALDFISKKCRFIFITGGLGPTSDDITREVVAKWCQRPLELNETVWRSVEASLVERGVKISPAHKSQGMFPHPALILPNAVGTAQGFYIETSNNCLWVLPGPTPELQYVWQNSVAQQLRGLSQSRTWDLKKWRCLGKPESELADLVEAAIKGSKAKAGYRITAPYVEIKIWTPTSISTEIATELTGKVRGAIAPWIAVEDDRDLGREFVNHTLTKGNLVVIDDTTNGRMAERLFSILNETKMKMFDLKCLSSSSPDLEGISFDGVEFLMRILGPKNSAQWTLELKTLSGRFRETLEFKSQAKINSDRLGRVKVEMSLKRALEILNQEEK